MGAFASASLRGKSGLYKGLNMNKELRINILRNGGKKALKEFNKKNRIPLVPMNTGTRVHLDKLHKREKHRKNLEELVD